MTFDPIRLGVIGLGRAFVLMVPAFRASPHVRPVAASAPRERSRSAFQSEFGGSVYDNAEALCSDRDVEAVYIASPHQLHAEHAIAAAKAGKHALVDKPIAISLSDARDMIGAFVGSGTTLIVGPSHSFDVPVLQARDIIASGRIGQVRMVHALNCTDFLYRPRRPEELRSEDGGGVVFSQGAHQIDIVRLLCGARALTVSAMTGNWDPDRPTEGAYSTLIGFEGGAFASLTYSGYGHFDSDEWQDDISELGYPKSAETYGHARRALRDLKGPAAEAEAKTARTFGTASVCDPAPHHEHFGPLLVFGERGDLRITPKGVHIYGDDTVDFVACPMTYPRSGVLEALYHAVRHDKAPQQTGAWGLASLEICHAILQSAKSSAPVALKHQAGTDQ